MVDTCTLTRTIHYFNYYSTTVVESWYAWSDSSLEIIQKRKADAAVFSVFIEVCLLFDFLNHIYLGMMV